MCKALAEAEYKERETFIDQPIVTEQQSSPYMAGITELNKTQTTKHSNISSR